MFYLLALLGFGFVIFIHELGHFCFAKWAGVRVERFSIGFPPHVWKIRWGETEYCLGLLPFGGYVKMTGQEDLPKTVGAVEEDPGHFLAAPKLWQAAIMFGGVLFNFLSSYLIILALAASGMPMLRPVVGEVDLEVETIGGVRVESPAARLGLRPGDEVLAVNGERTRSFTKVLYAVLGSSGRPLRITVHRPGEGEMDLHGDGSVKPVYSPRIGAVSLGFELGTSTRIREVFKAGLPTQLAPGDRIVAIEGVPLAPGTTGQALDRQLSPWFGREVVLGLLRNGSATTVRTVWGGTSPDADAAYGLPVRVASLSASGAAASAGVRRGDLVEAVDGIPVSGRVQFLNLTRASLEARDSVRLALRRDGIGRFEIEIAGTRLAGLPRLGIVPGTQRLGRLGHLPTLPDGSPGPLLQAGLAEGDTIAWMENERGSSTQAGLAFLRLHVLHGGERILVPLPQAKILHQSKRPGFWARLFGAESQDALLDRLLGRQVIMVDGPQGRPTGSPVDGSLALRHVGGGSDVVDLLPLGDREAGDLLAALKQDDWIVGTLPVGEDATALELLRASPDARPRVVRLAAQALPAAVSFEPEMISYHPESLGEAFTIANDDARDMIFTSLKFVSRFFRSPEQGGIDHTKQLQGPVGIFTTLKSTAELFGLKPLFHLIALIGLNLVLVNLLPIPITDGGQLVRMGIEALIRRPLPVRLVNALMWGGLVLVVALMLYVTSLDLSRML